VAATQCLKTVKTQHFSRSLGRSLRIDCIPYYALCTTRQGDMISLHQATTLLPSPHTALVGHLVTECLQPPHNAHPTAQKAAGVTQQQQQQLRLPHATP
jgi:hypothetical protein